MKSYPYQVVGTGEREESLFFMLDALLRSRIETGEETTDDEDVNVYLASLLHSFLDRSFFCDNGDCLSSYGVDVFALAEGSNDLRTKYHVYKGNADYALVSVGVFEQPYCREATPHASEFAEEATVARAKLYYGCASDCSRRLARRKTGVTGVLEKLCGRIETYLKILSHMRAAYLHLLRRLTDGEMFHLQREAQKEAVEGISEESRDRFLDAYAEWLRTRSESARLQVNRFGEALTRLDPAFGFQAV
ncbi:MAG: hypothetical protein QGI83_06055 [Candidatus Latescibacteria bacterium]|nr:hypothetical protein [Candidatus Latescibacterota bacterium]